jgi:hypothetical protein
VKEGDEYDRKKEARGTGGTGRAANEKVERWGTNEVTTDSRAKIGKELRSKRRGDVKKDEKVTGGANVLRKRLQTAPFLFPQRVECAEAARSCPGPGRWRRRPIARWDPFLCKSYSARSTFRSLFDLVWMERRREAGE